MRPPVFNYDTSNDGSSTVPEDRFDNLESGGIPVEVISLGEDKLLVQGQGVGENIVDPDVTTSWDTYWYDSKK